MAVHAVGLNGSGFPVCVLDALGWGTASQERDLPAPNCQGNNVRRDLAQLVLSSGFHLSLGAQKPAPETKLLHPADLIDQFAFFARMLLVIPDHAILRFPAGAGSPWKAGDRKDCGVSSDCGHADTLLSVELHPVDSHPLT